MNPPKVSVIVPVYKAEKYLHRCVDSILAQTFTDFEVLLIDDGSPDRSGEICDEYAKKESRVRVFHKVNGGVSSARQCGIDNAQGEYTIHVDPDDWVEPNMLQELYAKAKEDDADMVICDFWSEYEKRQIYNKQQPSKLDSKVVFRELLQQLHCSCWNKLIKLSCYNDFNIHFPMEMNLWEDRYVMLNITMHPIKISYLPKAFYHYDNFSNINSIVRKPSIRDLNSMIFLITFLEKSIDTDVFSSQVYKIKADSKCVAFRLEIPYKEFYDLYAEINNRFIADYFPRRLKDFRKLLSVIAFCLKVNNIFSIFLRQLYRIIYY